jgi:FKBP-type peptidyl-prolyl cis-trans isomerase
MKSRSFLLLLALGSLVLAPTCGAETQEKPATTAPAASVDSEDGKKLYALGFLLARRTLIGVELSEAELQSFQSGVSDALGGEDSKVVLAEVGPTLQTFVQDLMNAAAETEKEAAIAFVQKAGEEEGAEVMSSGVIFVPVEEGSGPNPVAADTVKLHYHGTLRDGKVFDSSVDRGEPATFSLNGVIQCFSEGLQKMKVGGKAKLVCPAATAYGDRGSPPHIKPGAAIVFNVELLEIVAAQASQPAG